MATSNVLKLSDNEYYVLGKKASSYEYNVAWGLEQLGFEYEFQVSILGGREMPGGQVLDFLIGTIILPTPLKVNGEHWHKDALVELRQEISINEYYGGSANLAIVYWDEDCLTPEIARQSLERDLL